jgi:hypothetical protein
MSTYSTEYKTISRGRQRAYLPGREPQVTGKSNKTPQSASRWVLTDYPTLNTSPPVAIPPPTPIYGGTISSQVKKTKIYFCLEGWDIYVYGALNPQPNVYGQWLFDEHEGSMLVGGVDYYITKRDTFLRVNVGTTVVIYAIYDNWFPFVSEYEYFETYRVDKAQIDTEQPNYLSLLNGYSLDVRQKQNTVIGLIPNQTFEFRYQFYRQNKLEQLPLKSIDWINKTVNVVSEIAFNIDITDIVLGTFVCNDAYIENQILAISIDNYYPLKYLFQSFLDELFAYWRSLIHDDPALPMINLSDYTYVTETIVNKKVLTMGANVACWLTGSILPSDKNYDVNDPFFATPLSVQQLIQSRHFNIQPDNIGRGTIVADSQRTIDMLTIVTAIKQKVDSLVNSDLSTVAKADKLTEIKLELDVIGGDVSVIKNEII